MTGENGNTNHFFEEIIMIINLKYQTGEKKKIRENIKLYYQNKPIQVKERRCVKSQG